MVSTVRCADERDGFRPGQASEPSVLPSVTGLGGRAPEAAGLLAASLGLSRIYADDLAQLDAGMLLYDAFYRWCRDATEETHNWPTNKPKDRA